MIALRQNPTEKDLLAKHIRINVKKEGKLDLIIINEADHKLQQVFLYDVHVEEGAGINLGIFVKNGKFNKHIVQVYLENGAEFNTYGLMYNDVKGDTEIITKIVHQNPDSVSNQFILGMAGEESQTVFQGMTVLDTDSTGSEANIECGNLILAKGGRCHSKPDIYCDADEVYTAQGTFTEYINDDKIYYLQTKGLSYETAKSVLIKSFQDKVFDIIPYEDIREEVKDIFNC
jgi:Fe-S cluster assembly protein SufD